MEMKKIPSVFKRDYDGNRLVYDEVVEGCEWVLAGEGVPTQKYDGTAVLIQGGKMFKRYEVKKNKQPPEGFIPGDPEPNPTTGKWAGWVPVDPDDPANKWHVEALERKRELIGAVEDGTYELIGPKVQGNPYKLPRHTLVRHGEYVLVRDPRTFDSIREFLSQHHIEGIVWHHPDGRMAKIKAKDFGIPWPRNAA